MAVVGFLDRWWWLIGPLLLLLPLLAIVVAVGVWLWGRVIRPGLIALRRAFEAESVGVRPRPSLATVLSPRGLARLLYVPRNVYEVHNPLVARASLLRSVCGVLLWLAVAVNFSVAALFEQLGAFSDQLNNAMVLGALVVVAMAVLVVVRAPAGDRWLVARAFARPLLTMAITAGMVLILYATGFILFTEEAAEEAVRDRAEHGPWVTGAYAVFGWWLTFFIVFAVYYNARHLFNAADAHPVLAPVGTTVVAWLLVTAGLLAAAGIEVPVLASNYASPVPASVALPLSAAGASLITGLAAWEYWLLRRDSFHLLRGPWR